MRRVNPDFSNKRHWLFVDDATKRLCERFAREATGGYRSLACLAGLVLMFVLPLIASSEQPELDPREHWAFQPPKRPTLVARERHRPHESPIDVFIARAQARHSLTPQPTAPKHVLLRRVYLDLIGLPPTRKELHHFLAIDSPSAYEQVVDQLLDDPRYGERWGRHWMDVWRYSDWYGRRGVPDVWNSAPQIWRWRDWIVRSLNKDKGYDQMIREMLAADEICPEDTEAVVATGYLIRNWYALNPNDWMRSSVEHVGKAFLGLTFNCAHCHDHKYDPITQEDYFRLRAFFEPMYVRQDRVPGQPDPGPFQDYDYSTQREVQRLGLVRVFDKTPEAPTWFYTDGDERNRVTERGSIPPGVPAFLANRMPQIEPTELPTSVWYPGLIPSIQEAVLADARKAVSEAAAAVAEAEPEETSEENDEPDALRESLIGMNRAKLVAARAELASVEARIAADRARYRESPGVDAPAWARTASRLEREAALHKLEADALSQQHALAVAEAKPESDDDRNEEIESASQKLETIQTALDKSRAALAEETAESYSPVSPVYPKTSTGRRRALAAWITSPDNPLTARVAVNHMWMRHFHAPLVETVYDFGLNGASPTHPQLLDWLAVEFMESGWSMKHLHRLMVTSDAYRRVSAIGAASENTATDPENRWLWRMNPGRMEAEVLRDNLLYIGGRLDPTFGGEELENSEALTTYRRSLYYSVHPEHGGKSALGELFDAPDGEECYRRTRSTVPQQALALTNSDLVHQLSSAITSDWRAEEAETSSGDPSFVIEMFERILSRTPTGGEQEICLEALEAHRDLLRETNPEQAETKARESLVRVLLNHNDFVTIR